MTDKELPVKVEAALAVQSFLTHESKMEKLIESSVCGTYIYKNIYIIEYLMKNFFSQIKEITLELLKLLQQTESDDITSVVQKVIATYYDTLAPIMYDICHDLVCFLFIINIFVLVLLLPL